MPLDMTNENARRQSARNTRASVIIPTKDGARRLPSLLEALRRQDETSPWEVLVVFDGSTAVTSETLARFSEVSFLHQPRRGPASARNKGASRAKGEFLVFIDDDCLPQPDWLREMLRPFSDAAVVGVKGAYTTSQSNLVARFVQAEYEQKFARLSRKPFIDFIDGFSAAFRRKVFMDEGGYDESFTVPSVEDREFSLRLSKSGGRMVFNPRAVVDHEHVSTFGGYLAKKFKYGKWGVRLLRKMPARFAGDDHTPHSQRLHVLLIALLPLALLASIAWSLWISVLWVLVFLTSSLPLLRRVWTHGWKVGLVALPLVFQRALGLTAGLLWGAVAGYAADSPSPRRAEGTDDRV